MGKDKGLEMLRLYRPPRTGALLLVCGKCQRKLLESGRGRALAKISDALDGCAADARAVLPLRVMEVGCMKECPKDGVTLCALRAGEHFLPQPVAVHSAAEAEAFFRAEILPVGGAEVVPVAEAAVTPVAGMAITPAAEMVSEAGLEPATVSLEG